MTELMILNIGIEIAGIILGVFGLFMLRIFKRFDKKTAGYFKAFFLCVMAALLSNIVGLTAKGHRGITVRHILMVSNFCEFAFEYAVQYVFTMYVFFKIDAESKHKGLRIFALAMFAVQMLLLMISQFTGLYYTIDADNMYHRSAMFPISQMTAIIGIIFAGAMVYRYRRRIDKREINLYKTYVFLPLAAVIIGNFIYGIYLTLFSFIVMAVLVQYSLLTEQMERYYRQEAENEKVRAANAEMKLAIAVSQIQPHFIYNALNMIEFLCHTEPESAAETLVELSRFLRADLGALDFNHLVSMHDELETVKAYLAIEKKRFEDNLTVGYDIRAAGFMLPPMSVQPIVENAVKYGLRSCERINVRIASYEDENNSYIVIADNGSGFDVEAVRRDSNKHIGIKNVENRLKAMCGGTLDIITATGKGTTVRFIIPKEQHNESSCS